VCASWTHLCRSLVTPVVAAAAADDDDDDDDGGIEFVKVCV